MYDYQITVTVDILSSTLFPSSTCPKIVERLEVLLNSDYEDFSSLILCVCNDFYFHLMTVSSSQLTSLIVFLVFHLIALSFLNLCYLFFLFFILFYSFF
jgi:hypothetical protein